MSEKTSIEKLVFSVPLYLSVELLDVRATWTTLVGSEVARIDGHCVDCGKASTFFSKHIVAVTSGAEKAIVADRVARDHGFGNLDLTCARDVKHRIRIIYFLEDGYITKVGEKPSLADIANDDARQYRGVLNSEDSGELHKAIGLAAHGVGIGSFVYLRRIFERLVIGRFNEFQAVEGWREEDFYKLRMDEKVDFLSGHLPKFLVDNKKLYSILSAGIHELSESICLAAFQPIVLSIKIILEEDRRKREELDLQRMAASAISQFQTKTAGK